MKMYQSGMICLPAGTVFSVSYKNLSKGVGVILISSTETCFRHDIQNDTPFLQSIFPVSIFIRRVFMHDMFTAFQKRCRQLCGANPHITRTFDLKQMSASRMKNATLLLRKRQLAVISHKQQFVVGRHCSRWLPVAKQAFPIPILYILFVSLVMKFA